MLALVVFTLAGCQQLPLTPEDIQARKFEAVPDKAVIYLFRDNPDFSEIEAAVSLDGELSFRTYPGTYYRWEVAPGMHRIQSFGGDTGQIRVQAERGKVYFVQQRVAGMRLAPESTFENISEAQARAIVQRCVLVKPMRGVIN
jgi:hypothetical protein